MQNRKTNLLQTIYLENLTIINGIKLTRREIDIIAFFVCGRSAKKIASFFSISPKTVENHTHNIMLKLGCNSRESIIDFIEKSNKFLILRKYYTAALTEAAFDKCLKDIAKLSPGNNLSCAITYWQDSESPNFLVCHLETSLRLAGINVFAKVRDTSQSFQQLCQNNYVIYIIPNKWKEHAIDPAEASLFSKSKSSILFFRPGRQNSIEISQEEKEDNYLNKRDQQNYYLLTLEILTKLLPNLNAEKLILEFKRHYESIEGTDFKNHPLLPTEIKPETQEGRVDLNLRAILGAKKWHLISAFFLLGISIIGVLEFTNKKRTGEIQPYSKTQESQTRTPIRSDLVIPIEAVRLDRPELMAQLEDRFKGWSGIQTVALVGIQGAGKTTLARHYASSQELNNVWEINAETKETLNESFENLAHALSKTEEDHKILTGILQTKISIGREEKLIQFVKERLRLRPSWFLIYDNVERFSDIQNHFPKDPGKWGQGRIVLTTRDSNIENNRHVNNVILMGELSSDQKLNLFIKIMNNGANSSFTSAQQDEAKKFLAEIPPFPLDVSVAAYYLKATHISYKNYLENMTKYNKDFSNVQEEILQEAGDYTKTRYGILTLTIKHLIDAHPDFKDLLLFISLLDSQNIPRELLIKYKGDIVVDNFIYHLKKYSLITNKALASYHSDPDFSIHRSIQAIILAHLVRTLNLGQDKSLIQSMCSVLENYMSEAVEKEDFAKMKILYRHAEQLLSHGELLINKAKGTLSGELGCIYCYLCYHMKAKQLLEEGLSKLNQYDNKNYNKKAHFLVYLGNVHRRLGDYKKAKELFEQSLATYKKCADLPVGMARASGYLGAVYESLGDFTQAKALLEKSLLIHEQYPKNRIGLAWSLAHLGSVYRNLGDYKKARELFEQSLSIYKTYSENYVGAAWVCGDLGSIYINLGEYEKAKVLLEESLKIYSKHFFEDHIYVAKASVHLGNLYKETGYYEKAKNLLKKGLIVIESTYGKDHSETGSVLKNLGQTYFREGNLEAAKNIMEKALDIFHKNNHPDRYMVLEGLAEVCIKECTKSENKRDLQQFNHFKMQAISYLKQALEIAKIHFPEGSPHIIRIEDKLKKTEKESS